MKGARSAESTHPHDQQVIVQHCFSSVQIVKLVKKHDQLCVVSLVCDSDKSVGIGG